MQISYILEPSHPNKNPHAEQTKNIFFFRKILINFYEHFQERWQGELFLADRR